ncbi:MAG: acyltransferase [Chitinophagaceae bacterium]|nr:MAG: acyltransferase [Chitinophagaceae bacterium]
MQTFKAPIPSEPTEDLVVPKKAFLNYLHTYRAVITILVVAAHVWLDWPEGSPIALIIRIIVENATVMFMFLAGFLFQYHSYKFRYKDYLANKGQTVLLPYLLISVPIIFYRLYTHDYGGLILRVYPDFGNYHAYQQVGLYFLHGSHMIQLWFIPVILIFYVCTPLWLKIDRNPKWYYLLIVFFIVSLAIPRTDLTNIPQMFVHFIFPYLFGMFASHYQRRFLAFSKKYWQPTGLLIVALLVLNFIYADKYFAPLNFIAKVLFCGYLLILMRKFEKLASQLVWKMGELSLGVYFTHYYFILGIREGYPKLTGHEMPANLFYWFACAIVTIALSFYAAMGLRRILGPKSPFVMGTRLDFQPKPIRKFAFNIIKR